jgi:dienelactone hydrolase
VKMSKVTGRPGTSPRIEIQPTDALVDTPVTIRLEGFPAGQQVMVRAHLVQYLGCPWESRATFRADAQGRVDVSTQRPVDGTYEQPDPMGLFWSMTPPAGAALQGSYITSVAPLQIQCTAEVNASVVASAQMERRLLTPQVLRTEVRTEGLVATLFRPPGAERHPTVVVVGGSRGGLWEAPAALLASHGFVTLALAYFGIAPLPPGLVEIPLEYFGTALRWLQRQEGVNPHTVAVLGQSRGGELALLLGATFPDICAVVAYVPSGVLWMGIPVGGTTHPEPPPAWTWQGRPLPFMRDGIVDSAIDWAHPPVALAPGYIAALHNRRLVEEATIPVEKTQGPILLISGQEDRMSSPRLAEVAVRRAQQHHFAFPIEHVSYPQAGHLLTFPYLPTTLRTGHHPIRHVDVDYGGTPAGDAFACADLWPKVVAFLRNNLES